MHNIKAGGEKQKKNQTKPNQQPKKKHKAKQSKHTTRNTHAMAASLSEPASAVANDDESRAKISNEASWALARLRRRAHTSLAGGERGRGQRDGKEGWERGEREIHIGVGRRWGGDA